jgi:ATP-dependent protease HslVU (ClpYQ) peptidase subunit
MERAIPYTYLELCRNGNEIKAYCGQAPSMGANNMWAKARKIRTIANDTILTVFPHTFPLFFTSLKRLSKITTTTKIITTTITTNQWFRKKERS